MMQNASNQVMYSVGDMRAEFGVSARTLRYYEQCQLIAPSREGAYRVFSEDDRARLAEIVRLRKAGMCLADISALLDEGALGSCQHAHVALKTYRAHIEQLKRRRQQVDEAIVALRAACKRLDGEEMPEGAQPDRNPVAFRPIPIRMSAYDKWTRPH